MKSKSAIEKALIKRKLLIKKYMRLRVNGADIKNRINDLKHLLNMNIIETKECMREMKELDNLFCAETQNQKETKK